MNDITKLIQAVEDEKRQKVSAGVYMAGNPDQSAKIYSLAEQKKLPFEYVQRHYDQVSKPDVSTIAPILSRLLEDRRKAEMAYDDIDNLNWWEQVGRETVNLGRTAKASLFGFSGSAYGVLQSASDAAANITDVLVPEEQERYNPFRKLGQFFGQTAQGQFQVAGEARVKDEETNFNLAVLGGVESAFTQIPALTAGLLSRNPNLALGVMGSVTYGQSYSQAKESGLDDITALSYAVNQSIAEMVTERIPAFRLLEDLGKNSGLTKTLMAQLATEIPSEQVATIWQDVNEWAYLNPDKTLNEFVAERPEAAVNTLISTIVASGLQTSALYGINKLANDQRQTIETLQAKAKESKLNVRASQVFQEHVQEVIEGDIFIDAAQVRELYQGLKDDSFKQLIDRQLEEAEAVGGDIVIPVGKFVSDVANSPNYEVLKEHFRLSPDKGTQDVAGFVAEAEKQIELKTRADEIYKEVSQQLIDTGRMTPKNAKISASIIPAYVTTKAARTGKSVDEIYNMMGLKIVGPDVDLTGRVLEQPVYKDAPIVFDEVRNRFLDLMPEDSSIDDVMSEIESFSPQQRNFIKALDRDNWLGFDSPAQAISAALSGEIDNFEVSTGLKQAIGKLVNAPYTLYQAKTEGFEGADPIEAQGPQQSERRGQISILPDSLIIQLGKSSDLSTFLHESGHLFLEMEAKLYQEGDKDGKAILDWLGAESFESITVEQHEKWARGFEKYLGEGKAPSVELQSVFRRFAAWMKQVYQSLVNLNVELTDDIRAVMDRLLASDEQIDRMKGDIAPLFESAEEAGATQAEFESYQNRSTSDIAKEKLREKLLGQLERQHKKWWKDESAFIAKKARKQFKEKPLYAAIEYMRGGDNSAKAKSLGSQIETLESDLNKLSRRHPTFKKLLFKAGGINRLEAAENGVDQENFKGQTKLFPTKGGLSFDGILETLAQEGVQVDDVTGFINGILKEDRFVDPDVQAKADEISNQIDKLAKRLDKVGENKLNTTEVEAHFFGKPPGRFIGLTSKTGSDADVIAARFGIASGADLIDQINTQPTFKQAVDAFVEQEMVNRHGDALKDGTLEALAEQAVHNVEYAKKLSAELTFLSRKTKTPTIDREQLKEYAKSKIGMMRHSEIYPNRYRSAELRAARKAVEAKTKKDFSAAQRFKQQELVNFYLAKEAQDALDRADRIRSSLKSIQTKKYDSTKYHNEVVNQAKVIIAAYDFRKNSKEAREIAQARIESVRTWIRSQNVDPDTVTSFVDAEVLGKVIPYKDMTVNDLQGLDDVVKSMMFAAKKSNEAEYKQDIENGRQWLSENRIDNYETEMDSDTPWHQAKNTIRGLFASLRKMESLVRQADGMKEQGWLWKRTIKPLLDAENRALTMRTKAHKDLNEIFKGFESAFNGFKDRREFTLDSGKTITMSYGARISMALNMGNADNLEALRNMGRLTQDHTPYMTQNDIDNIVSTLNDSDWDLVQNIWDYVDTYWKEISELEIRRSGVAPKKVEAQPFVTPTGKEMRGGYYPLVGDPIEDPKQQDQDITTEAKEMMAGGTARKSTKHGSTIERVDFGGKKINFSIDVLFQHLDGVIHDITHWQAVKDVDRLLRNPKIYSELTESLGKPGARVLKDRLKEIAAGPQKINGLSGWERFFRHARLAATYNALGYSVRTSVMNLIGVTTAIADMDASTVAAGVAEYYSGKSNADQFILSKSDYMRDRGQVLNRDIATIRNGLKGDTRWNKIKDNAFWLMTQTDKAITRPIWIAAYRKGETMFDTEEAAIDYADRMVARTQGSGLNLDLSNIETRNEFVKSMTVMFSAMNAIYNITTEQIKKYNSGQISGLQLTSKMAWLMVVPAIFEMLLKGDEEPEEMVKSVPEEVIYYALGLLPVGRDAASSIKYSNVFPPPAVGLVLAPVKLGKEVYDVTQGEGDTKQFLRALTDTLSWGLVPGGAQFNRTTGYLMEIDGEFNPYSLIVTGKEYGGE